MAVAVAIQIIVLVGRRIHHDRGGHGRCQKHRCETFKASLLGRCCILLMGNRLCGKTTTDGTKSGNAANGSGEHFGKGAR